MRKLQTFKIYDDYDFLPRSDRQLTKNRRHDIALFSGLTISLKESIPMLWSTIQ